MSDVKRLRCLPKVSKIMGSRDYNANGRLFLLRNERWEPFTLSGQIQKSHHLSLLSQDGGIVYQVRLVSSFWHGLCLTVYFSCKLHLNVTPSIPGGPTKILVDDLGSRHFRHKLAQDLFVQWSWKQVNLKRAFFGTSTFTKQLAVCRMFSDFNAGRPRWQGGLRRSWTSARWRPKKSIDVQPSPTPRTMRLPLPPAETLSPASVPSNLSSNVGAPSRDRARAVSATSGRSQTRPWSTPSPLRAC